MGRLTDYIFLINQKKKLDHDHIHVFPSYLTVKDHNVMLNISLVSSPGDYEGTQFLLKKMGVRTFVLYRKYSYLCYLVL